jgi:RimJ/RimL family protein N-acetyltransferase
VGTVGVFRDRHVKAAHKAHLWGMYVAPHQRRQGIAADLLQAALRHARTLPGVAYVYLSVSTAAPAAQRLYERAGFRVWGTEPDALRHAGQTAAEHHMTLRLD